MQIRFRPNVQEEEYISALERQVSVLDRTAKKLAERVILENQKPSEVIVLDIETTGLDYSDDEILQISIISGTEETLFDSYIKPIFTESWKEAERVNGISPEMVKDSPNIYEIIPEVNAVLRHAKTIIGYNHLNFDIPFLKASGAVFPEGTELIDVMFDFAEIYGEYSEYFGDYKWQTLAACAAYYGYDWGSDKAHNSLSDCRATLFCYHAMQNAEK